MSNLNWKLAAAAVAMMLAAAGCNTVQRDSALRAVRSLQQSGTAQAAVPAAAAPQQAGPPGGGPPPGAPPPPPPPPGVGKPPAGGPAPGKAPDAKTPPPAPGKPGAAVAGKDEKAPAKTPDDIIKDFMKSDPRDILVEKAARLKEKETKPWDQNNPDTFIPETGRKDPLTAVRSSIPAELLPKRTGDDDTSDLQTYLIAQFATTVMAQIEKDIRCYSVIQIGLDKFARMSFDPAGKNIQTLQLGSGNTTQVATPEGVLEVSFNLSSISSDEVVIDMAVSGVNTKVSVQKQIVFIPRDYS